MAEQVNMQADDSKMVDDILNELNSGGGDSKNTTQQKPPVQNNVRQEQPNIQMNIENTAPRQEMNIPSPEMEMSGEYDDGYMMPEGEMDVEYDSNDSKINKVLSSMKKPLIVIALSFILHNPYTINLLSKFFPKVFAGTDMMARQVKVLCLALILGIVFLAINLVV